MNEIIIILMLVCGQPDTVILKYPESPAMVTHSLQHPDVLMDIAKILNTKHILITYEDDRGICA